MDWLKIEVNPGGNYSFHIPPVARDLVSKVLGDNCPQMFQRDTSGRLLDTPPAVLYGGCGGTMHLHGIGLTGLETLQHHLFDILNGLRAETGSSPLVKISSGSFPDELHLSSTLIRYRIPRLMVKTQRPAARERWFGPHAKDHVEGKVRDLFLRRMKALDITVPEDLVFGDVNYERSVPIAQDGVLRLALVNVTFRTNAQLPLLEGAPFHLGAKTSLGFGVVLPGGTA